MEWQSTKFDFENEHWSETRNQWVPELGCQVGQAISALKKSWAAYKIARRLEYEDRCMELEARINDIQSALGLEETQFGSCFKFKFKLASFR